MRYKLGRKKYPICKKCGMITEVIGHTDKGICIYGCKTPEKCGYEEYEG